VFGPNQNKNQIQKGNLGRNPNPKSKGVGAHLVAADGPKAPRRRPLDPPPLPPLVDTRQRAVASDPPKDAAVNRLDGGALTLRGACVPMNGSACGVVITAAPLSRSCACAAQWELDLGLSRARLIDGFVPPIFAHNR
jgi:hypothetical protein